MNEEKILTLLKEDMKSSIEQLHFESVGTQKDLIGKQFDVLQALVEVVNFKSTHCLLQEKEMISEEMPSLHSPESLEEGELIRNPVTEESPIIEKPLEHLKEELFTSVNNLERPMYLFHRKIRGGFLQEIEGFVPEGIVRRLDLEDGDYVYAKEIEPAEGQRRRFLYDLAKKGAGVSPKDRVQLNYCPVEKEGGVLVIKKSLENGKDLRLDEVPYTLVLNQDEINEFQIYEGDIIDIAYPVGKMQAHKILWVHKIEKEEIEEERVNSNSAKKDKKLRKVPLSTEDRSLEGKTVLVIGNEPMKPLYKVSVESKGGIFHWADAKDGMDVFEPLVRKSDMVIFLLAVSGHTGMKQIKRLCKDYQIPFQTTFSLGQSTIVRIAEETDIA